MNNEQRLKSAIVLPQEVSGPDPVSSGSMTLVAPFNAPEKARGKEDLRRELAEVKVNSVEDICREFDVRITGTYEDVDGEQAEASIAVIDEDTFTVNGMTHGDPQLFRMYIRAGTYEQCEHYLSDKQRDGLTDEEIAHLETTARYLEESLKENDHE